MKGEQRYAKDDIKAYLPVDSSTVDHDEYDIRYYSSSSGKSCSIIFCPTDKRKKIVKKEKKKGIPEPKPV